MVSYTITMSGDAKQGSDYDIAVFLRDMPDRWQEMKRLADLSTDILYDTGEIIHAMPHQAASYSDRSPVMQEIRRDGIDL